MKILYYRHIFWKNEYWKRLNSRKWTSEKNWNFIDSWKLIPSEYNFMTNENKYLQKTVLLRQLGIFLSLKTLLQRDNILSMFLSVWMGKSWWNQNTASSYATNWNQIGNEHLKKIEISFTRENWYPHNTILWLTKINTCKK